MLALKTAFRTGIQPDAFWNMTANELKLCVEASNGQALADRERDLWWAWHVAFLHRVEIKHFPKLTDLIKGLRPKSKSGDAADPQSETKSMSRELMNALLQFKTAPKPESPPAGDPPDPVIVMPPAADLPPAAGQGPTNPPSPDEAA